MSYTTILKGIAQANKVKIAELTKKMIQNAPIPVRYKKFLQGKTLQEARMAKTLKSHRGVVPMELKALGIGLALGDPASKLVNAIWSTRPTGLDDKLKAGKDKRKNTDYSAGKPDELQTEPMDSSKDRTGRRLSPVPSTKTKPKPSYTGGQRKKTSETPKAKVRPKLRPKSVEESSAPRTSLKPKLRPKNLKDGGMPMVMKDGKKVPEFAADGVGKMNKGGMTMKKPAKKMMAGGMAKKKPAAKKMMAGGMAKKKMMGGGMAKSTGYMYGGMAKKTKAKK